MPGTKYHVPHIVGEGRTSFVVCLNDLTIDHASRIVGRGPRLHRYPAVNNVDSAQGCHRFSAIGISRAGRLTKYRTTKTFFGNIWSREGLPNENAKLDFINNSTLTAVDDMRKGKNDRTRVQTQRSSR